MKQAAAPRKELGVRTVFNVLGPLANPAGASTQLLGVATPRLVPLIGEVLSLLGCGRAMVVHGHDGMDELSLSGATTVRELNNGSLRSYEVEPEDVGLEGTPWRQWPGEMRWKTLPLPGAFRATRTTPPGSATECGSRPLRHG